MSSGDHLVRGHQSCRTATQDVQTSLAINRPCVARMVNSQAKEITLMPVTSPESATPLRHTPHSWIPKQDECKRVLRFVCRPLDLSGVSVPGRLLSRPIDIAYRPDRSENLSEHRQHKRRYLRAGLPSEQSSFLRFRNPREGSPEPLSPMRRL